MLIAQKKRTTLALWARPTSNDPVFPQVFPSRGDELNERPPAAESMAAKVGLFESAVDTLDSARCSVLFSLSDFDPRNSRPCHYHPESQGGSGQDAHILASRFGLRREGHSYPLSGHRHPGQPQ